MITIQVRINGFLIGERGGWVWENFDSCVHNVKYFLQKGNHLWSCTLYMDLIP